MIYNEDIINEVSFFNPSFSLSFSTLKAFRPVSMDLSFIVAIVSVISTSFAFAATSSSRPFVIRHVYNKDGGNGSEVIYSSLHPVASSSAQSAGGGPYIIYHRRVVWFQQVAFLLSSVFSIIILFSSYVNATLFQYLETILLVISIFISLWGDGVQSLPFKSSKKYWLPSYLLFLSCTIFSFVAEPSSASMCCLLSALLGVLAAVYGCFFSFEKMLINVPTDEQLCGLFDYITFRYLNPILILPGFAKGRLLVR